MLLSISAVSICYCLMFHVVSVSASRPFSSQLHSSCQFQLEPYCCIEFFLLRDYQHFPLLNLRFLLVHFSSLLSALWMAALLSSVSTCWECTLFYFLWVIHFTPIGVIFVFTLSSGVSLNRSDLPKTNGHPEISDAELNAFQLLSHRGKLLLTVPACPS